MKKTIRTTRRRSPQGFTLIEMVVATFVLAIAIVSCMAALSAVIQAQGKLEGVQTATLLAQRKFNELDQQADSLSGGDQQGEFDDNPGYHWKQSVETTDYQNLFKVTVTIQWGNGAQPDERTFTSYLRSDENVTDDQIRQQQSSSTSAGTSGGSGGN